MNHGTRKLEEARKFIIRHWRVMTDKQMAHELDLNIVSVRRLRYRLGLVRSTYTKNGKL